MGKRKAQWQNDYIAKAYDRINLTVPKGEREEIRDHAAAVGQSVNEYIRQAVRARMAAEAPPDTAE